MVRGAIVVGGLGFAAFAIACASSEPAAPSEPPCVAGLSTSCKPQYDPPDFATLHAKIFAPTCATGGASCHGRDGKKGGLDLSDEATAYAALTGKDGARARVVAGDPACSVLVKRVASSDPGYHMPPGSIALSAGEQCAITLWIARGAAR